MIKFPITITHNAWTKIAEIIRTKSASGFLFSALSGGCNGFNYSLKLLDKDKYNSHMDSGKFKPTVIEKDSAKVLVDPMSEMFLIGTTIDYVSADFNKDIFESKFVFIPNKDLASTCGCGISFAPKT